MGTANRSPEASPRVVPGAVAFNGERAMEHVKKQLEIGPRIPGSPELARTREYILRAGIFAVLLLFALVTYNDLRRLVVSFVQGLS